MACSTDTHVKLYCPRTGVLCQDIGPSPMANNAVAADPLFPAGVQPDAVCGLLSRKEEEGGGEPSPRPHFLVLTRTQARTYWLIETHLHERFGLCSAAVTILH